ncbi:unnamed protein product [Heterosigma akashiwo]|mmetsp:Transcript_10459/g.14593  ORF Transcript_10459/g.14593 Transcript_10459/m.14593 type:complete len:445 (-) Transcript_10459:458-1792(-)
MDYSIPPKNKNDDLKTEAKLVENSLATDSSADKPAEEERCKQQQHQAENQHLGDDCCEDDDVECFETFDSMNLCDSLLRGIYAFGFEKPSAIQQKAIMPVISGRDVIAQAQSGTGKTATFTVATLEKIDPTVNSTQALILAPTRELAKQIYHVAASLAEFMPVHVHVCVGGTDTRQDIQALRRGAHVVIGTPGRVFDMANRGALRTDALRLLVLDEADEMLQPHGFQRQVQELFAFLPEATQVAVFSATLPLAVLDVARRFLRAPLRVLVKREELTLDGIRQFYVAVEEDAFKLGTLCDLYETLTVAQAVIFANARRTVDWLAAQMNQRDFTVSAIHGDMDQRERDVVMREFKSGSSRVLVATDLLARGIDVQQVSLVINFDLPRDRENYIHRVGRSGRFGRKGTAISLLTRRDAPLLRDIEVFYGTEIKEMTYEDMEKIAPGH